MSNSRHVILSIVSFKSNPQFITMSHIYRVNWASPLQIDEHTIDTIVINHDRCKNYFI